MPDQSLLPHYATGQIVPQGPSAQRADTALSQLGNVSMLVIAAIDETYGRQKPIASRGHAQQDIRNGCWSALPWS